MLLKNKCEYCQESFEGRRKQRFCDDQCRSSYHNDKRAESPSTYSVILTQLKLNRRLLKKFNRAGLSFIEKKKLIQEGFDPNYFTHTWKSKNNKIYLFCFEFGFREEKKNGKWKYTLIHWQDYMK